VNQLVMSRASRAVHASLRLVGIRCCKRGVAKLSAAVDSALAVGLLASTMAIPAGAAVGPNLLSNADFSAGLAGWAWSTALMSHQPGDGASGLGSAQGSPDDDGYVFGVQCVDIPDELAGSFFVFGGWVKPVNYDPVSVDSRPASQLNFYSDDNCVDFLQVDGGWDWLARRTMGEWRRSAWAGRAPAGTGSVLIFLGMVQAPLVPLGIVRIDDAFLRVVDPPEGLIHFWPLESTVRDVIGGAVTFDVGSPVYQWGRVGRGISMDGIDDAIRAEVNIGPQALPQMTIGAWVRPDQTDAIRAVLSQDDGGFDRALMLDNRGDGGEGWAAFIGAGVMGGREIASAGDIHFVAAAYDEAEDEAMLYVDGSEQTGATSLGEGSSFFVMGNSPYLDLPFDGLLDEVFIFDRVLEPDELTFMAAIGLRIHIDGFESGDLSGWSLP